MARPRIEPKVKFIANIPEKLSVELDLLLVDTSTGEIPYGAKSQLAEQLLRKWCEQQKALYRTSPEQVGFQPDPSQYTSPDKREDN